MFAYCRKAKNSPVDCFAEGSREANPSTPARKTTNFDRNLSFFSCIRLAASYMRKRVIFASQVICASHVEDYKANIISL